MITRDESRREIKEVEKILPPHAVDLLVIVDDLAAVWGPFASHVVGILPFYYFKDPGLEKFKQPELKSDFQSEPKNEQTEDNKEQKIDEKAAKIETVIVYDCFLKFLPAFLERLHKIFFAVKNAQIPKE